MKSFFLIDNGTNRTNWIKWTVNKKHKTFKHFLLILFKVIGEGKRRNVVSIFVWNAKVFESSFHLITKYLILLAINLIN